MDKTTTITNRHTHEKLYQQWNARFIGYVRSWYMNVVRRVKVRQMETITIYTITITTKNGLLNACRRSFRVYMWELRAFVCDSILSQEWFLFTQLHKCRVHRFSSWFTLRLFLFSLFIVTQSILECWFSLNFLARVFQAKANKASSTHTHRHK